jgi:anti-sigma factor RsiW
MNVPHAQRCSRVAGQLSAWLDGETGRFATLAVERHLVRCLACARRVERLAAASNAVGDLLASRRLQAARPDVTDASAAECPRPRGTPRTRRAGRRGDATA